MEAIDIILIILCVVTTRSFAVNLNLPAARAAFALLGKPNR